MVSEKEKSAEKVSRHENMQSENREGSGLLFIKQLVILPALQKPDQLLLFLGDGVGVCAFAVDIIVFRTNGQFPPQPVILSMQGGFIAGGIHLQKGGA